MAENIIQGSGRKSKFYSSIALLFLLISFCLLIFASGAYAGEPTRQVKETVDKIIDILKDERLKKPEYTAERRKSIRRVVNEKFDFEEMAKRALGIHWRARTAEERKEFVPLFSDLLERSYINRIEGYTDEKIIYIGEKIEGEYSDVDTKIITKRNVEIPIRYRLLKKNAKWDVYDVVIEGVSLISNYRNQFNRIIRSQSYEELVRRMKDKQEELLFEEKK
jgi:phospholipid transport system substrate-binding protein